MMKRIIYWRPRTLRSPVARGSQSPCPIHAGRRAAAHAARRTGAGKIKHVVYIVQENRSFDNLFQGYPGADTVSSGKDSKGAPSSFSPCTLSDQYDIDHSAAAMFAACNGTGKLPGTRLPNERLQQRVVLRRSATSNIRSTSTFRIATSKPYFDMAHEGVVADRMFQSHLDESFVSHQYIIAAQAASSVDLPYGAWGCARRSER